MPCCGETVVTHDVETESASIVDDRVKMLIAAGAAMAANCEPCLNKIVPLLMEAGVAQSDIRQAVEIAQFVKDKPAAIMKEAADVLTGTHLAPADALEGCPLEAAMVR